jgi:hypothetical protein
MPRSREATLQAGLIFYAYGNAFRYRALVVHEDPYPGEDDWAAYDVLLQHVK